MRLSLFLVAVCFAVVSLGWKNQALLETNRRKEAVQQPETPGTSPRRVNALTVTPLKLPGLFKPQLPCMLWADAQGSAFFTLEAGTGVLRRISFPDLRVMKQKDFERKFTWMSLSARGLLLTDPDPGKIWVVDPATFAVKSKIAVRPSGFAGRLKRVVSAPAQSRAVVCVFGYKTDPQSYYLGWVDLVKKKVTMFNTELGGYGDGSGPRNFLKAQDNPALSPDGTYIFTECFGGMGFWGPSGGYWAPAHQSPSAKWDIPPSATFRPAEAGITFSPDSKWVCLPTAAGNLKDKKFTTVVYRVKGTSLWEHQCTLEQGRHPQALGFDLKAGSIYTQNNEHEIIVFTVHGVKKKEYTLGKKPAESVIQYLVHPGGYRLVMLTRTGLYAIEVPRGK